MHLHRGRLAVRPPRPLTVGLWVAAGAAVSTLIGGLGTQLHIEYTDDALWQARVGTTMLRCGVAATGLAALAVVAVLVARRRHRALLRQAAAGLVGLALVLSALGVVDYRRGLDAWPGLRRLLAGFDLGPDSGLISRTDEGKPTALGPRLPWVQSVYSLPLDADTTCGRARAALEAWADPGTVQTGRFRLCDMSARRRGHGVDVHAVPAGDPAFPAPNVAPTADAPSHYVVLRLYAH